MTEADSYRAEAARLFEVWETRRGSIGMSEVRTVTIDHSAGSFIRDGVGYAPTSGSPPGCVRCIC